MIARFDPYLPVGIEGAKREVLALYAFDHSLPDMLGIENPVHHLIIGVGQKEIGARHVDRIFVSQEIDKLIDGAGGVGLNIGVHVLAEDRDRCAVENELDIGIAAGAGGVELVGAVH